MVKSFESKLDVIMKILNILTHKIIKIEKFIAKFDSDARLGVS